MALNAGDVIERVRYLEDDQDHRAMRDAAKERHDLVNMLRKPDIPEHLTKGMATNEPSPLLIWLAATIAADVLPYPTTTIVTPFGTTRDMLEQADRLEKFLSICRARLDDGRRATANQRNHQLLSPYGVMVLRCGDPSEPFPWILETPDPLSCFFPIKEGPMRPDLFGRRYRQVIDTAVKKYSGKKGYRDGAWGYQNDQLTYDGEKWGWRRLGTQTPPDQGTRASGGPFEECEFVELHDGEMVYHLAVNSDKKDGEIVWQGKSMTGGVSAVIIPGHSVPIGAIAEMLQPVLWPEMQMVNLINKVRAKRASRSDQLKPDALIEQTPEMLMAQEASPQSALVEQAELEAGRPNIIKVPGRPLLWELQPDPDLDKQEASYWEELRMYIQAHTEQTEPQVIKETTANAYLTNLESRKRQKAPMLSHLDWGWNEINKMVLYSIKEYNDDFALYATNDQLHKDLKRGEQVTITPADVDLERFYYEVETKSTTEAEARMRVEDFAYRKGLGLATQREGIKAAGYNDESAQIEALATDAGMQGVTPWVEQQVQAVVVDRIRLRANIILPMGDQAQPQAPPMGQELPDQAGKAFQQLRPMRPAAVPGATGGSGAA